MTTASSPSRRRYDGPPIEVLHEDEDYLLLAKPAAVTCSDDEQHEAALPLWLAERFAERIEAGAVRPEPCHRLDRGTTGVVAVALTARAFEDFRLALETAQVEKTYEVVVRGQPPDLHWRCRLPLKRAARAHRTSPRVVVADRSDPEAWTASTDFEILSHHEGHALLRAQPLTGRTHQIRAHCLAQGLPVLDDPRYGDTSPTRESDGQLLHARSLRVELASRVLEASSDWPESRRRRLARLGLMH
jgi:RluA family pseudouridine synthase